MLMESIGAVWMGSMQHFMTARCEAHYDLLMGALGTVGRSTLKMSQIEGDITLVESELGKGSVAEATLQNLSHLRSRKAEQEVLTLQTSLDRDAAMLQLECEFVNLIPSINGPAIDLAKTWLEAQRGYITTKASVLHHKVGMPAKMKFFEHTIADEPQLQKRKRSLRSEQNRLNAAWEKAAATSENALLSLKMAVVSGMPDCHEKSAITAKLKDQQKHGATRTRQVGNPDNPFIGPEKMKQIALKQLALGKPLNPDLILCRTIRNWTQNKTLYKVVKKNAEFVIRITSKESSLRLIRSLTNHQRKWYTAGHIRQWQDNKLASTISSSLRMVHSRGIEALSNTKRELSLNMCRRMMAHLGQKKVCHHDYTMPWPVGEPKRFF